MLLSKTGLEDRSLIKILFRRFKIGKLWWQLAPVSNPSQEPWGYLQFSLYLLPSGTLVPGIRSSSAFFTRILCLVFDWLLKTWTPTPDVCYLFSSWSLSYWYDSAFFLLNDRFLLCMICSYWTAILESIWASVGVDFTTLKQLYSLTPPGK